jgi:ABC-type multidrug transport system ATPase subunit
MTPLEYLDFVGELKGLGKEERESQVEFVMKKTQSRPFRTG